MKRLSLALAVVLVLGFVLAPLPSNEATPHPGVLTGIVLDRIGRPVADAAVRVVLQTPNGRVLELRTRSNRTGHFGFRGLPPSKGRAKAEKPRVGEDRAPVTIRPGHTTRLHLVLH